jgi:hypothetical protein|tara:strand:+ start:272 stop:712 length:441 start_codon:yes stop_codon:yes gene_type:complete
MKNLFFVLFLIIFSSCSIYKPVEFKGISNYSFSKKDGCKPICIELNIYNPNPYDITFKSAIIKGSVGKHNLGELNFSELYSLKKMTLSNINLKFDSELNSFMPLAAGIFNYISGSEVVLSIDGILNVKVLGFSKNILINQSISITE